MAFLISSDVAPSSADGAGGSPISIQDAQAMIDTYIKQAKGARFGLDADREVMAAIAFGQASLDRVLTGAAGLRFYFGLEKIGGYDMLSVIVVGIDEDNNDLGFNPSTLKLRVNGGREENGVPKTRSSTEDALNEGALLLARVLTGRNDFDVE